MVGKKHLNNTRCSSKKKSIGTMKIIITIIIIIIIIIMSYKLETSNLLLHTPETTLPVCQFNNYTYQFDKNGVRH